jgi:hypothetical protein
MTFAEGACCCWYPPPIIIGDAGGGAWKTVVVAGADIPIAGEASKADIIAPPMPPITPAIIGDKNIMDIV